MNALNFAVPGKWILCGEHSVLRGSPALVFPLQSKVLNLKYTPSKTEALSLDLGGDYGPEFRVLFWGVVDRACELSGFKKSGIFGQVRITSQIPIGSGLGASASLCVAIGKWFESLGAVKNSEIYEFSRQLENLFHGESSGVDIAVALNAEPIRFSRSGEREKLQIKWKPNWYLSYSGKKGSTLECVNMVKALHSKQPELGKKLDQQMQDSVELAHKALLCDETEGFLMLQSAMNLSKDCFEQWGLCTHSAMNELLEAGASAVKPTGSGGGGYVLSLWKNPPPKHLEEKLILCW